MKIEAKLATISGQIVPVLFFPDEIERDKTIGVYSLNEGRGVASRAYMRNCKKPESQEDIIRCYRLIIKHCNDQLSYFITL